MKRLSKWILSAAGFSAVLGLAFLISGLFLGGRAALRSAAVSYRGAIDLGEHSIHIGGEDGITITEDGIDIGGNEGLHLYGNSNHTGASATIDDCSLDGLTDVDVELSLGDIIVKEGDLPYLELSWTGESCAPKYSFSDGELRVWSENNTHVSLEDTLNGCSVTVTLPENTTLREIDLSTDLGSVTWKAAAVCQEADLSSDLGDVMCSGLVSDDLSCETNMGDVSVSIPDTQDGYRWKLKTDMGNVKLNDETKSGGMGTIQHEGGSGKKIIDASSNMGNVSLDFT